VVVTRNPELKIQGCIVTHSLDDAIKACTGDSEIFIVGGAELYTQALTRADKIYLTEIQQDIAGDTHFPEYNQSLWQELTRTKELGSKRAGVKKELAKELGSGLQSYSSQPLPSLTTFPTVVKYTPK
jgi:dihydrofolate reductase